MLVHKPKKITVNKKMYYYYLPGVLWICTVYISHSLVQLSAGNCLQVFYNWPRYFGDEGKQRNMVGSDRTEPALGLKIKQDIEVWFGPDVLSIAERERFYFPSEENNWIKDPTDQIK